MNKLIKAAAVVGLLGMSAGANASMINVGGVNWDPDYALDFSAISMLIHQDISSTTGIVSGYGQVGSINDNAPFCLSCELTFTFGGFTPIGGISLPNNGLSIDYTGGWINFYVDYTPEGNTFAAVNATNAGDQGGANQLWLSLVGHQLPSTTTFTGTTTSSVGFPTMTGQGSVDVIGGLAAGNFDTNTLDDGFGGFADVSFTTSFSTLLGPANNPLTPFNERLLSANGSGNLSGNTIPEPASLALLGIGLLGFGAARRRA